MTGFKKPLANKKGEKTGEMIVKCEKVAKTTNNILEFNLAASNLPSSSSFCCFGSSTNTFFRIYRIREKDQLLIYESETIFDNPHPRFKKITLSERRLCKNNPDGDFEMRFYKYSSSGSHEQFGKIVTTVNKLMDTQNLNILDSSSKIRGRVKA